jgi:hypothetical protein
MRSSRLLAAVALTAVATLPLAAAIVPAQNELGSLPASGRQHRPSISMHNGGSLVAWEDDVLGVVARRLSTGYGPLGTPVVLAANDPIPALPFSAVLREERDPAIAARGDGTFAAAWLEQTFQHSADIFYDQKYLISSRVMARVFNADGTPASRPFTLSSGGANATVPQAVAAGDDWFVVWQEREGSGNSIHMATIDRRGQSADIAVSPRGGVRPSIALGGNAVLVAFERSGSAGVPMIFGRLYTLGGAANGNASAAAFSAVGNAQGNPVDLNDKPIAGLDLALATGTQGRILGAWDGFDLSGVRGLRARPAQAPAH